MDATIPLQDEVRSSVNLSWNGGTREIPLVSRLITVGRDPSCDVMIEDPSLSRRHAVIEARGEGHWIRDLRSSNGTWVRGERIEEHPLRPGESLRLGSVLLSYRRLDADDEARKAPSASFVRAWVDWLPRERARFRLARELERAKANQERSLLELTEAALRSREGDFGELLEPLRAIDREITALTVSRDDLIAHRGDRRSELASERASREAPLRLFEERRLEGGHRLRAIEAELRRLEARRKALTARSFRSADDDLEFLQVEEREEQLRDEEKAIRVALEELDRGLVRARSAVDEALREERSFGERCEAEVRGLDEQRRRLQRKRLEKALEIGRALLFRSDLPPDVQGRAGDAARTRDERASLAERHDEHVVWLRASRRARWSSAVASIAIVVLAISILFAIASRRVVVEASAIERSSLEIDPVIRATGMLVVMIEHEPSNQPMRYAYAGMGTCFAIDRRGLLFTNRHNLEAADELRRTVLGRSHVKVSTYAIFSAEECYRVEEIYRAVDADFAAVRLIGEEWKEKRGDWPHLKAAGVDEVGPNTDVWAVGFPAAAWEASQSGPNRVRFEPSIMGWFDDSALAHKFTKGIVSCKPYHVENGTTPGRVILSGATINPGNSGGPLVNVQGHVLGINTYLIKDSSGMNHALVLEDVLADALQAIDARGESAGGTAR